MRALTAAEQTKLIIKALKAQTPASNSIIKVYEDDIQKQIERGDNSEIVFNRFKKHIIDMYRAS